MKIYGIVVIYNHFLKDSVTIQSLATQDIELVVCDNSDANLQYIDENATFAKEHSMQYLSMNGNQGLSYAYNRGVEFLLEVKHMMPSDWVVLLDDDTTLPENYVEQIILNSQADDKILLPIVLDGIGIMSPVYMPGRVARRLESKEAIRDCDVKKLSGINSAMVIRAEIFQKYRYNEEMFLDYIDHMFIMDMRRWKIYPRVLDVSIRQHFSAVIDSKEAARKRFRLQKKDLRIFYRKQPIQYAFVVFKKHLKLVIKYKDITMLFG